jgi:glyoxylase I family protein
VPVFMGIHHVALSVSNRDASAEWYARMLDFEELFREEGADRKVCVMRFRGDGYAVGLVEHSGGDGNSFDPRRRGLDHVAFTVASLDELSHWADRLSAHGIEPSRVIEIGRGAILNFRDPDGLALALFWDRPDPPRNDEGIVHDNG